MKAFGVLSLAIATSMLMSCRNGAPLEPYAVPFARPSAAPVAHAARTYLVFFDWNRATLTARAEKIIAEAAQSASAVGGAAMEVSGYADTSGSAQYNYGLSLRRARVVAAELERDGVPSSAISLQAFGDTHLFLPTGANVREPQNRRVEIIFR